MIIYRDTLLDDVIPFWRRHGLDCGHPGYLTALHRDGRISVQLKGNLWKGPFHLPRMLWYCWKLSENRE